MEYLLGIDIGSTNLKANLYDGKGNRLVGASRKTRIRYPDLKKPKWAVYDPDELWNEIAEAVREVVNKIGDPGMIKGIAIAGMGEPGIPIDKNGNWLYPAITWFDPRTDSQVQWWKDNFGPYKLFKITGQPVHPIYSINKMMWLKKNEPVVYKKMKKWLNLEDYIIFRLTGNFATDRSLASRTMGFDVKECCWSKEIFQATGVDIEIMCPVYPSGTVVGQVSKYAASITGLAENIPVVTGGHDHGCAALAARVFEQGSMLDSTGTTESILTVLDAPILSDEICNAGLAVYPHPAKGKYQVLGGILFSGGTLEWYVEQFGHKERIKSQVEAKNVYSLLLNKAESVNVGSSGLVWFPQLRGTFVDPTSRGALIGITSSHRKEHVLRAIIEGLCFELRATIEDYEQLFSLKIDRIVAVGGATESDFWMQTKADITGKTIEIPAIVEAASLGAAILSGIGVGIYRDHYEAADKIYKVEKEFKPHPERSKKYESYYQNIYKMMYSILKPLNTKINREVSLT